jgi:PAT family beta-lactamase induction signal transducer AmpG
MLGLFRAMLIFGCLQALSILGYMALALVGKSYIVVFAALIGEHVAWGMGTAALLALLMALCDHRYTATQFALLTAIDSIGRVFAGPFAGHMQSNLGWAGFYLVSALIALPGLLLLCLLRERIHEVERDAPAKESISRQSHVNRKLRHSGESRNPGQ